MIIKFRNKSMNIFKNNKIFSIIKKPNMNEIPHLSKYYTEPIVDINENVIQEIYITDYYQKEYLYGDSYKETFNVRYWIDEKLIGNAVLESGDNFINFGKMKTKGEHWLAIQVVDKYDRESRKMFIRIKAIQKGVDDVIPSSQIYTPTLEELQNNYNIYTDNLHSIETTNGFNALFSYLNTSSYKKIIFPNATYYVAYKEDGKCILLDSIDDLIVDFSNSTLKLVVSPYNGIILNVARCNEVHIKNLIIHGDLDERYANQVDYPLVEWAHGAGISGSIYCSFENFLIKKIVGYGTIGGDTGHRSNYFVNPSWNNYPARRDGYWIPPKIAVGDIDTKTGEFKECNSRVSSTDFVPLRAEFRTGQNDYDLTAHRYFGVGKWGYGKGGLPSNRSHTLFVHFYDKNKNFIETIPTYIYSYIRFKDYARYAKFTFIADSVDDIITDQTQFCDVNILYNCQYKNIRHEDCRCVGTALTAMSNVLFENPEYYHCGWNEAKCTWDCEDGWQAMQDLTLRGYKYLKGNGVSGKDGTENGASFLNCSGHNFVAENNEMLGSFQYDACKSFKYRNNIFTAGAEVRTGQCYFKSSNNTYTSGLNLKYASYKNIVVRNETIKAAINSLYNTAPFVAQIIDSTFEYLYDDNTKTYSTTGGINSSIIDNCVFNNQNGYLSNTKFNNCTFNGDTVIRINNEITDVTNSNSVKFTSCIFNNNSSFAGQHVLVYNSTLSCSKFNAFKILEIKNTEINTNILYEFISLANGTGDANILFENCVINDLSNKVMFKCQRNNINVVFNNCTINKPNHALCPNADTRTIKGLCEFYYGITTVKSVFTFNKCTITDNFIQPRDSEDVKIIINND